MGCGCKGGGSFKQQKSRVNLQSLRRPAPPPEPVLPPAPNLGMVLPEDVNPTTERRRIQRLQRDAINKRFNK